MLSTGLHFASESTLSPAHQLKTELPADCALTSQVAGRYPS